MIVLVLVGFYVPTFLFLKVETLFACRVTRGELAFFRLVESASPSGDGASAGEDYWQHKEYETCLAVAGFSGQVQAIVYSRART